MTKEVLCSLIADGIQKIEGFKPGTRAYKNNNPGNLWDGLIPNQKTKRIFPSIPIDDKGFLIFKDFNAGRKALERDILIKVLRGLTLKEFIYMYAPPNENNTEKYIELMEKFTDIKRDTKLKTLIK